MEFFSTEIIVSLITLTFLEIVFHHHSDWSCG